MIAASATPSLCQVRLARCTRLTEDGKACSLCIVDHWFVLRTAAHSDGPVEFWVFFRMLNWREEQGTKHVSHIVKAFISGDTTEMIDAQGRQLSADFPMPDEVALWKAFQAVKDTDPYYAGETDEVTPRLLESLYLSPDVVWA